MGDRWGRNRQHMKKKNDAQPTPHASQPGPDHSRRSLCHGALTALAVSPVTAVLKVDAAPVKPEKLPPQVGDLLAFPSWEHDGRLLTLADLPADSPPQMVFPHDASSGITRERSRLNQILVVRLDQTTLDDKTRARSADGIVAYSGRCTHAGCGVTDWNSEAGQFICPCHGSEFDPRRAAQVMNGPATRALAAIPIAIKGEHIEVQGPFTGKLGPAK